MVAFAWRPRAISAHPSRGSWPHRELHRRPQGPRSHAVLPPLSAHPHEDRGLIGSSTEGPRGRGHIEAPASARHTPHEDRGLIGSSTECPRGRGELHRRPQGARSHRGSRLSSAHPSRGSWHHRGISTEGPIGAAFHIRAPASVRHNPREDRGRRPGGRRGARGARRKPGSTRARSSRFWGGTWMNARAFIQVLRGRVGGAASARQVPLARCVALTN